MSSLFAPPYAPPDEQIVPGLARAARLDPAAGERARAEGRRLVEGVRARVGRIGGLEDFLRDFGLSTREGLALMAMAEALLRVPDKATQDRLIEDKIGTGDWSRGGESWFVSAATWGLGLSSRILQPGETPGGLLADLTRRIGAPAVRQGVRQAMRFLGHHFVLGETIGEALRRAREGEGKGVRHSYDMLGEGARSWADARRHARAYAEAIEAIGRSAGNAPLPDRPGISVKLSALHPRYEARQREAVMAELVPVLLDLARAAKGWDLNFTVDAEEMRRLELSVDVIEGVFADASLRGWDGFGLAVQAYGKRAPAVIERMAALARAQDARMMVRLVKGAYWDTEVKAAQVTGLDDFPVFTRKAATDLSFLACARQLLDARGVLFPQFATHNALTVATVREMAGDAPHEFQRLHGMGEELYALVRSPCRVYAPVGGHRDLLAYLVRRLLENGANTSFVAQVGDRGVPVETLLAAPEEALARGGGPRHPAIRLPTELFPGRPNSRGVEFGSREALTALADGVAAARLPERPAEATPAEAGAAMEKAAAAFPAWRDTSVATRAAALDRAAELIEGDRDRLLALIAREGGRTLDDGISELREAADFCRFYASEARRLMVTTPLPGPAGEENVHTVRGRGVFVSIAPWNFPLAIFTGQAAAALVTGNTVVAKPAPQTPRVAAAAVALLHKAGIPEAALRLIPGGADQAKALLEHPALSGVVFTGSTGTARAIARQLAGRDGPIVPFIAETGGINAMIADATALPEQVTDDVVAGAFRSAGQRCSALRILYLQEDVAEGMLAMIEGAAATLHLGDPADPATDMGPIIDTPARERLGRHVEAWRHRLRWQGEAPGPAFFPPTIIELAAEERLTEEVFGPVLHVKRFAAAKLDRVVEEIEETGYGLTFALHSRIGTTVARVTAAIDAGNLYVNRNQIGAVVGSQPFGGRGMSGTGPKAGGPLYLTRFVDERVLSTDTAAAGGNASLLALGDPS